MKIRTYILLIIYVLILGATQSALLANPASKVTLSVEEEQQFLYYFYEAQRLIQDKQIEPAWELVQFCYALNPSDATINNYMGVFLDAFDRQTEAIPYFQRAFELQPNEYWYQYCLYLLQSKDKKQEKLAIRHLEQVAKSNPKDENVHTMLQKAYIHMGDYKAALQLQNQLDTIIGYNAMSAMQRYRLNATMKKNKQAIQEIERYLELEPNDYQFQLFRMQLYEQTMQPPTKMIPAYEAILKLDPRNVLVMNNLAWNLCLLGKDLMRAEELSRITIMREPTNPIYLDTYGWTMYKLGHCEEAIFYLEKAIEYSRGQIDKEILSHYNEAKKKCK